MTPMAEVCGIIAGHFNRRLNNANTDHDTASQSYNEILRVLELMGLKGQYPVYLGSQVPMISEQNPINSEGVNFIVREALRKDERPLYIACQGSITDLASALLLEPDISSHITCIWVGGGAWPHGGWEFNLWQDIHAVNVIFKSQMPVWQIPMNVYKKLRVSLAELEYKVYPCGAIGKYLFEQTIELNAKLGNQPGWPHGEIWELGDQSCLAVLMQDQTYGFDLKPAPQIAPDYSYIHSQTNREICVYYTLDNRMILEDFFCKLALNYSSAN